MKTLLIALLLPILSVSAKVENWQSIDGYNLIKKKKDISKTDKKVGVFYFLSATCPCSKGTFEYLNDLQKKYPNFQFVGFHSNKMVSNKVAETYFSQYKIDFPIYFDKSLEFANKFEALKTPHVFVLDEAGEVLYHGGVTNSRFFKNAKKFYLEDALKDIAAGSKPKKQFARALGCYIER